MKYQYLYNIGGNSQKAEGEFDSLAALKEHISSRGGILIEYKKVNTSSMNAEIKFLEKGPAATDVAQFAEQMAVMLDSGANVRRSLHDIGRDTPNAKLKRAIGEIEGDVEVGSDLSEAMGKHPSIFDNLMVSLVQAGEASNKMDTMLMDLGAMKRSEAEMNNKVRSAMVYPSVMLVAALLLTYLMLTKMVPQFADMVTQTGGEMPALTKFVMGISGFMVRNQIALIIGIPLVAYSFARYRTSREGKPKVDHYLLKMPIIGPLLKATIVSRISRALSLLLRNGVRMPQAVRILQGISGNEDYKQALIEIGEGVKTGERMSMLMREYPELFPGMMVSMMAIGEESGKIDTVMAKSAEHFEREASHRADTLTKAIEPMMLIFVGLVIGTIVIAMFLPMISLMQNLQK